MKGTKHEHFPGCSAAGAATGDRNLRKEFGVSGSPKSNQSEKNKNPNLAGFGPRSTKIGFDRLCRDLKIDFLPFGTLKNPNRSNPAKNTQIPVFLGRGEVRGALTPIPGTGGL